MFIEFTGHSASGKTEFVRHMLSELPGSRSIRSSVEPTASPLREKLLAAGGNTHKFPLAFLHALKWHQSFFGLTVRSIRASLLMAAEYSLLTGISESDDVWFLDQGRLQFSSWLPKTLHCSLIEWMPIIKKIIRVGDGVVCITLPAELSLERIRARQGLYSIEKTSRNRGYASVIDFLGAHSDLTEKKLEIANKLGAQTLNCVISSDGSIEDLIFSKDSGVASETLLLVAAKFESWWQSD